MRQAVIPSFDWLEIGVTVGVIVAEAAAVYVVLVVLFGVRFWEDK